MSGHRVTHRHDQDVILSEIICDEPADAFCRLLDESCETWWECTNMPDCQAPCTCDPDDHIDEQCGHPAGRHCIYGHPLIPRSTCQVVDNIDCQDGVAEAYAGPDGVAVHDGPIRVWYETWQQWAYDGGEDADE